ncbi:acyl-CoA thioesterase [Zeaxanthinibacter enoshimensis]|uniref:Acyl-CoA thioester hydrolase n=1 Tax=Zeaxanthinibacter enoshimensis TaxID=392009 RepID=A0A4R6TKU5_9FLAO|nr:acyl-CoA thioesterase [Zeaxanthinibacter enoshimensis]TDQ31594.1 acyl-CoA thioester hydrolase [Zeaxanthinibacter enoshimensis]
MQRFTQSHTVTEDDLDDLQHVNNVRYVQWIQDISKNHWLSVAPPALLDRIIWVVVNHNITYKSAAKLGDRIRMETYIKSARGAISERVVEMYLEEDNELLVESLTKWCMLDPASLKPARIGIDVQNLFL